MKNVYLLIASFLFITTSCSTINLNRLSKKVFIAQKKAINLNSDCIVPKVNAADYHYCRKKLSVFNQLNINTDNDTLFILETEIDCLSHMLESTLFTRNGFFSYRIDGIDKGPLRKIVANKISSASMSITNKPLYPKYALKLTAHWNLHELKKESDKSEWWPQDFVVLTRIVFKDKKYEIDCVHMKYILDGQRDLEQDVDFMSDYKHTNVEAVLKEIFSL